MVNDQYLSYNRTKERCVFSLRIDKTTQNSNRLNPFNAFHYN
jgi:hypothetical protein